MKPSVDLFELIHSLSKGEKKYISISARFEKGDHNYYEAFKIIEKRKSINEEEFARSLTKANIKSSVKVLRYYLQKFILKKLSDYHLHRSSDFLFDEAIVEIQILFSKNLYSQAKIKLVRIKSIAEKAEEFRSLQRILKLEKTYIQRTLSSVVNLKDWDDILKQETALNKNLETLNQFECIFGKIFTYYHKNGEYLRTGNQREKVKNWLKHPLIKSRKTAWPDSIKSNYHLIRSMCYTFLQEYPHALKENKKLLDCYKAKSDSAGIRMFISTLSNRALIQRRCRDYSNLIKTIKQIREFLKTIHLNYKLYSEISDYYLMQCYSHELDLFISTGQFEKALEIIPSADKLIKNKYNAIPQNLVIVCYYEFAYVCFIVQNYRKTLFYLNEIINRKNEGVYVREDIYCLSKMLFILAIIEMQKESLPEYLLRNTHNFLIRRKKMFKTETVFIKCIRELFLKKQHPHKLMRGLRKFKDEIIQLNKSKYERNLLENFNFISWIESKISNRPFIEVLKAKHTHFNKI